MENDNRDRTVTCRVKWFDPIKGYGFLLPDAGGPDILLHANVLKNLGQNTISDGVSLEAVVKVIDGKWQAESIHDLQLENPNTLPRLAQLREMNLRDFKTLPFLPARVKWYSLEKGIGFANVFGVFEDVFLHVEVLRNSGLAVLQGGEAIAIKVIKGERGQLAVEVAAWSKQANLNS